jgi:hypothetical protein
MGTSKFIIECINTEYWDNPMYLKKIGPHQYNIEWTNDPYKAKTYDTKQRAEKESLRMTEYVKYCYEHGWSSHCYGWDPKQQIGLVMKNVEGTVREIKLIFV